jgi:hypothetical protein
MFSLSYDARVHDRRRHRQARADRVVRAEDDPLVLLQVAVVADGQALEDRHQREQIAIHVPAPPADQLEHVRVPLLRHHRAAGRVPVGDLDEAELGGHVNDPLLGPAGEVLGDHRKSEQKNAAIARCRGESCCFAKSAGVELSPDSSRHLWRIKRETLGSIQWQEFPRSRRSQRQSNAS